MENALLLVHICYKQSGWTADSDKSSVDKHMPEFVHMNLIHHTATMKALVNF